MDHLAAQDRTMETFDRKMETFEMMITPMQSSMDRIEKLLRESGSPRVPLGPTTDGQDRRSFPRQLQNSQSPKRRVTPDQKINPSGLSQTPISRENPIRVPNVEASPCGSSATAASTEHSSDHSTSSNTINVPVEHTTAAHRLLSWPSIQKLVHSSAELKSIAPDEEYVMQLEEEAGVLRVYGTGEGRSKREKSRGDVAPPQTVSSPAASVSSGQSDRSPDPSSPEGIWGSGLITPVTSPSMSNISSESSFDFSLNIHPQTLRRLLDSYLNNVQILHPFLDKNGLTSMVKRFSLRYNPIDQKLTSALFSSNPSTIAFSTPPNMSVDSLRGISKTAKKLQYEAHTRSFATEPGSAKVQERPDIMFERSIATAIVLLVMALGRICEWKDKLPGVEKDDERTKSPNSGMNPMSPSDSATPAFSQGQPSPASSASNALGAMANSSPPKAYHNSLPSPRPSAEGRTTKRNIDRIPGLSYYAPATDILGNLHGSNDLLHVQAYLLAGLYMGQLARTFESFNWISSACRACRFLVRE